MADPAEPGPRAGLSRKGRLGVRAAALIGCALVIPRIVCGHGGADLYEGDEAAEVALANEVAAYVSSGVASSAFHTGSPRFDGEWAFGTFTMAALGLGQVAISHPEHKSDYVPVLEQCAESLLSEETNAFGKAAWGTSPLQGLPGGAGHGYLGYANLALSMVRLLAPETRFAKTHDALTEALARRLRDAPHGLFETYPQEAYPADMSMVAGSIALHDCATGAPERPWMQAWRARFERYIDPSSGLVRQAADAASGRFVGPPRASGTALAAYALAFVDIDLSKRLFEGLRAARAEVLGFGAIREYAPGHQGTGDIDSGPVVLGASVSGTGFTLASARIHQDPGLFIELYRTAALFGVPVGRPNGRRFMSGGPLGNAILLAMTTADRGWERLCRPRRSP